MLATPQEVTAAALAHWEVEDDSGWHPCEQEVLQSLRVAGAGLKSLASCMVGSRLCELHLDARVEIDILTGKRRRLRITSPSEADVATAAVAQGGASELPDRPQPAREVAAIETAKPKKTLSRYFTKEKKEGSPSKLPKGPERSEAPVQSSFASDFAGSLADLGGPSSPSTSGAGVGDGDGDPKIGNEKIASIFEEMSVVQRLKRDRFRSQAYAKAAQALRALAEPIDSGAQAKAIKGIGAGMANRIDVILKTGELKELEELKLDSDVVALRELRSVHGIGAVSAAKLVERGIRSLAQLRDAVEKNQVHLDSAQALGLRHCEEFSKRIPQAEMKEHHKLLEQCCLKGHPDLLLTVCGSYRRGRPDCGDIDVLISHPDYTTAKKEANAGGKLLHGFVSTLKKAGYVTGDLAFGQTKFMGVCRLSRGHLHRRLDIRCMPEDQYHFGMLYFTGSAALSVKMRLSLVW
ncbi:unnamed protein product [Durusdinium trenchii]|uniref:DNA polymerase n=2 Tax=Durusdinium trenchii TaxID=1381693 RepID=A0ABP0R306_9DINO